MSNFEAELETEHARMDRYALFDELIDMALENVITKEEAIDQFRHDVIAMDAD